MELRFGFNWIQCLVHGILADHWRTWLCMNVHVFPYYGLYCVTVSLLPCPLAVLFTTCARDVSFTRSPVGAPSLNTIWHPATVPAWKEPQINYRPRPRV